MPGRAEQPYILLLGEAGSTAQSIIERAGLQQSEYQHVQTLEAAQAALHEGRFDLVMCGQQEFVARLHGAAQDQAMVILESIGQGVCIVGLDGRMVWANPRMQACPADLIRQVCEVCVRTFAGPEAGAEAPDRRARRFSLGAGNDQHFEVTITPVVSGRNEVTQVAAVVWDVTHSHRLQKKLDAIDLAGRELVRIDAETTAGMNVEERIRLLEQKMLTYMHDLLHFDNFAVLLIDKKTNKLEFVLQHGMVARSRDYDIFATPDSHGISGYVAATGRSYICHDTSKDPRYLQGLESAKSSLTVPLRLHDKIIGVFNIESDRLAAFNEDDRQYAEILARYVAIALNILDLLILERYESTGRIADDVLGEISGPLNDIVTEARTLSEEYIGNDELRHRLNSICDNVAEIKRKVRDVAKPRGGLIGRPGDTATRDPLFDGKRALVADDEETIRETIADLLRKLGCHVETAVDGREAIALLEREGFDIVLADIRMPHRSGYEVFATARDRHPGICVVLMTGFGYDPNHSIVRARSEGLNAVLFKPFKVDALLSEIRNALQARV